MKKDFDSLIKEGKIFVEKDKKVQEFLRIAYQYAENNSEDDSTWTGALIVKDEDIVAMGANLFAPNIERTEKRMTRPFKYECICHAERNAIYKSASDGISLENATIYTPWVPCIPCGNAIIFSGIKRLVMHYEKLIRTPENWSDNVLEAVDIIYESNVELVVYQGKIGQCKSKLRGKIWEP